MHTIALNVSQMHTNRKERMGDFTWRVSDCEELVGVTHTEEVKVSPVLTTATKVLFPNTISVRVFEVGEVLLGCSAF